MQKAFKNHIEKNLPFLTENKVIVAISGGIDSVVLTHLCKSLNLNFALAHCNFNLRNDESNEDENFVVELAKALNLQLFIQHFDTKQYAKTEKISIQMAARNLRYTWFNDLAEQHKFHYILTAHHADDNLETFLINFTRGTGLTGLTGIPMLNGHIARPLLPFSREQIEAYAKKKHIIWREDASNTSLKYLRNKLRHDVVPILKTINPQLLDSFKNTITNLNDTADIVDQSLKAVAKRAIVANNEKGITYKISEFKKVNNPKAYVFEMFKHYGFTAWNDVLNLFNAESGKHVLSSTHRLTKEREFLVLTDVNQVSKNQEPITINHHQDSKETVLGNLTIAKVKAISNTSKRSIYVDKCKLKFPLIMRLCNADDMFYPYGMKGKKKLSKYLKDEKLSVSEKENTWVLTSQNTIVWVVGKRADERFKVTDNTTEILKIEIKEIKVKSE